MNRATHLLLMFLVALTFLGGGCRKEEREENSITPLDNPSFPARGFFMGVLPSAAEGEDLGEAYTEAARYAEFVPVWGRPTPFYSLADDLKGEWGDLYVEELIRQNGMFPLLHLSFIGSSLTLVAPPEIETVSLSDPAWREAYEEAALDVVRAARPKYLSLGNEVNRWYEAYGEEEFSEFVSLYEEIYDAVKELSPETIVFCTFAREVVSENREADLSVLDFFNPERLDLLVFTSYPYSVRGINSPSDIPDDYYSQAADYMPSKPFGFSEIAWPSLEALGGEEAQADFILQAAGRLTQDRGLQLHLFGWPWLHDLDQDDAVGLLTYSGTEKAAYQSWRELSGRGSLLNARLSPAHAPRCSGRGEASANRRRPKSPLGGLERPGERGGSACGGVNLR